MLKLEVSDESGRSVKRQILHGGHSVAALVPETVELALRELSENEQVSGVGILLTAFGILVHRYTRGDAGLSIHVALDEEKPGNWLLRPIRIAQSHAVPLSLHDDMTLRQALEAVYSALSEAFPSGSWAGGLTHIPDRTTVSFEWRDDESEDAPTFSATLRRMDSLVTVLSSNGLLSHTQPILQTESHWQTLLAGLCCHLDTPISRLPIMDADESARVLREWRGPEYDESLVRDEYLHHLFQAQVDAHPERTALVCAGRSMTYGDLDARANQLARHLQSKGIGAGSYVAMMLPRSMDVQLSILAILKTGAAYVPIDPDSPADRVAFILEDCRVAALLTTSALADGLPEIPCPTVLLDWEADAVSLMSTDRLPARDIHPEDIAYVIYTSGTTGRPKGAQIRHRSVCNFVRSEGKVFGVQPTDRVYQGFSVSFDASVEEMWLAFFAGATLVVGTDEMVHAGPALAGMLADQGVTVLSCVPTLLSMMDEDIPTIRLLILGGEQCPQDLVTRWWKEGRRLVNSYGPTEATVVATCTDCHPDDKVTIGRPIPNYSVYILDQYLQPVPAGVAGELHIGGHCLAKGYLNRPDLTDEKFIPNPFAGDPGAPSRLYKTGDLVRFDSDGNIEYLGRIDAQVKIRGFRVELAEIESVLMQSPGVQSAVVSVREDVPGIQQICAYVIPHQEQAFDEPETKALLRSRLPTYMVPSHFVTMTEFPTLCSGKVDRKRLPTPELASEETLGPRAKPRTEIEGKVLEVWERMFFPQRMSLTDSFFDLGGHSLLAARMVSELRKDPRMQGVAMLDVYNHPTLEDFARKVEETADHAQGVSDARPDQDPATDETEPQISPRARFRWCALGQALGLYLIIGLALLPLVACYWVYSTARDNDFGLVPAVLAAMAVSIALFPVLVAFSILAKKILIGRYEAGSYPLWGSYYWRFWLARKIQALVPLTYFRGTPLLAIYYRWMGAKIGTNAFLGTHHMYVPDLLSIGDDSSIGLEAQLTGYTVENGMLHIGPITLGRQCYVGAKSVLHSGTVMEDGSKLDEQSMLPAGTTVPREEKWSGSPAAYVAQEPMAPQREVSRPAGPTQERLHLGLNIVALMVFLPAVPMLASLPCIVILIELVQSSGLVAGLMITPLTAALFVVLLALEIALVKRLVVPRMRAGRYDVHSLFYVRKWFVDCLMQMGLELLHPLYATLYLPPWFRLLGAKLGKRMEISTVAHITPELLAIGDECFIADSACMGATRVHLGWLTLEGITIGKRTFVGNSAVIPTATKIGDGCLIGCMSVPPHRDALREHPGSSWLGSPSVLLPRRQESTHFPAKVTFSPPWQLYLLRGAIEFFRVTLPSTLAMMVFAATLCGIVWLDQDLPTVQVVFLAPLVYLTACSLAALVVIAIKWLVMGKYKPCTKPLWSSFVWRTEMVTAIHESFAAPFFLNMLQGTPFISWYFRLMGSHIGKRVFMETTQVTEFDLVHIGDDAMLNLNCTAQTHLFEDRVMKVSRLRVGDQCSVGSMAVVLYDTEMQEGSSLSGLSLLMKGESLPAWTRWDGIPARPGR